jgi:hypothetical protein
VPGLQEGLVNRGQGTGLDGNGGELVDHRYLSIKDAIELIEIIVDWLVQDVRKKITRE